MPLLEELPGTFEGRAQVGGAAPASRTPPRPATDPSVAFPHLLCGFLCLEEWTKLSSGANCPGPRAPNHLSACSSWCPACLSITYERLGAPLGWVLRRERLRETSCGPGHMVLSSILI